LKSYHQHPHQKAPSYQKRETYHTTHTLSYLGLKQFLKKRKYPEQQEEDMSSSSYVRDTAYLALAALCGSLSTILLKGRVTLDQHGKQIYDDIRPEPAGPTRLTKFDEEKAEIIERKEVQQEYYCENV